MLALPLIVRVKVMQRTRAHGTLTNKCDRCVMKTRCKSDELTKIDNEKKIRCKIQNGEEKYKNRSAINQYMSVSGWSESLAIVCNAS